MSWGWLVALIVLVLLVGAGVGVFAMSNAVAASRWSDRVASGDAVATVTLPRLNPDRPVPVVAGTSLADLRQGLGWYEGSAGPGQVGNFALAGHRLGWGQPFAHLDQLAVGDRIEVATPEADYTYVVITAPTLVAADDASVLAAVPGEAGLPPARSLITLTTAAGLLPSPERLVVVGELQS